MKQFTFTLIAILAFSFGLQAQNYEFIYAEDTVKYNPTWSFVDAKANLKNISGSAVTLYAQRVSNDLANDHRTNFCWSTTCFSHDFSNSSLLNVAVELKNNGVDSTFKMTLEPRNTGGTTTVTMRFYNANDVNDYIDHTIVYVEDPTASISEEDLARGFDLSNPYPNPASDFAWIDYTLPSNVTTASLRITDMQGRAIGQQAINTFEDRAQIQTSDLASGVYFVNLMAEDRIIATSKLRVK